MLPVSTAHFNSLPQASSSVALMQCIAISMIEYGSQIVSQRSTLNWTPPLSSLDKATQNSIRGFLEGRVVAGVHLRKKLDIKANRTHKQIDITQSLARHIRRQRFTLCNSLHHSVLDSYH